MAERRLLQVCVNKWRWHCGGHNSGGNSTHIKLFKCSQSELNADAFCEKSFITDLFRCSYAELF